MINTIFIKKQLGLHARITSWDPENRIPREKLYVYSQNVRSVGPNLGPYTPQNPPNPPQKKT